MKRGKMRKVNVLVLCLVCSWVLTAGLFSPSPGKHRSKEEDVRVDNKERVVIGVDDGKGLVGNAKDKIESLVGEGLGKAKERVKDGASEGSSRGKGKVVEMKETMKEKAKEAGDMVVQKARKRVVTPLMGVVHLVGLAVAYGMGVWVTFASKYVLGGQQVGARRMYPLYFKAMAASVGMALLGHIMQEQEGATTWPHRLSTLGLAASLAMILMNLLYLEPRANKVMSERMKKEKEEGGAGAEGEKAEAGAAAAAARGRKGTSTTSIGLNLIDSDSPTNLLNLATLIILTSHLLHLAYRLRALS